MKTRPRTPWTANLRTYAQPWTDAAFGAGWRLFWTKAVVASGLISAFLLSTRLWLSSRSYPLCPVFDWLPAVPSPLDAWWFFVLLVLLAGIALTPRSHWLIVTFVGLTAVYCLFDQSRWQPWVYMYLFMLAGLAAKEPASGLNVCRWIMAATYFWSGLQKFSMTYTTIVHPYLLSHFLDGTDPLVQGTAWLAPALETMVGALLLVPRTRKIAVILVLAMHLFLLLCLGPLGNNWNEVVWPWNLAMMALAVILFWRTPELSLKDITWPAGSIGVRLFRWSVLVLFGVMPGLSFFEMWDTSLSAALYSGNELHSEILINRPLYDQLPREVRRYCRVLDERIEVELINWSYGELHVPPFAARRVFRRIARALAEMAKDERAVEVVLRIRGRPPIWGTVRPLEEAEIFSDGKPYRP